MTTTHHDQSDQASPTEGFNTMLAHQHVYTFEAGGETRDQSIWGLDIPQLHERFWASRCVQVARRGDPRPITRHAELYLLVDRDDLVLLHLRHAIDTLTWRRSDLLFIRLHCQREQPYRERLVTDDAGRFLAFHRQYPHHQSRLVRIAITPHRWLARRWQHAPNAAAGWRRLRQTISRPRWAAASLQGHAFSNNHADERQQFVHELIAQWRRPDLTIARAHRWHDDVWLDCDHTPNPDARFIGPVWAGIGRRFDEATTIAGPTVLWDAARDRQPLPLPPWERLEPHRVLRRPRSRTLVSHPFPRLWRGKRLFDLVFAIAALLVVLPLFPFIMLAIWLEDGRPFFFAHKRETTGGRDFPCLKFRSMRNDAERIKQQLMDENQVDGPQFFIQNDPRVTRVGQVLRNTHLDELPQLFNVLVGHMSIVGPRPSPYIENQYCPAWREARLSVRPGITGYWQVMRTRRKDQDFQEWIRYDIEYVERMSWRFDLWILVYTIAHVLGFPRCR